MKFYTSYFYKVRFFKPYQIGFSTAFSNPRFWRDVYVDKRGILNGLCVPPLVSGPLCDGDCKGPDYCSTINPPYCNFLQHYKQQLDMLDFHKVIARLEQLANTAKEDLRFEEEPEVIILFYEAPQNKCSERIIVQQWFRENGVEIEEWIE